VTAAVTRGIGAAAARRRHRAATRILLAVLAAAALTGQAALVGPVGRAAAAPFIDETSSAEAQSVTTATLAPLGRFEASRGPSGPDSVRWDRPRFRQGLTLSYSIERVLGGTATPITPAISLTGAAASFTDDLTAPAVVAEQPVSQLSAGKEHTCAVAGGAAFCWGTGHLGDGSWREGVTTPARVSGFAGKTVTQIAAGSYHTCAIADGEVYCWGNGESGRLGLGAGANPRSTPQLVTALPGTATLITAGDTHTCAVADGAAYCWGAGYRGQLGNGYSSFSTVPSAVVGLDGVRIVDIDAGTAHTCAAGADGHAYCWGRGDSGELGHGNSASSTTAIQVPNLTGVTRVTAGNEHSCVVANAQASCWGWNGQGQLGSGGADRRYLPTLVPGLAGVTEIDAGWRHTCANAGGVVSCWGQGELGQLGDGTTTDRSTPLAVPGTAGATAVGGSYGQSCTLVSGAALCWGENRWGQLGDGSRDMRTSPVAVVATAFTSGTCPSDWIVTSSGTRCTPVAGIAVSYRVRYTAAGWSSDVGETAAIWSSQ